MRGIGRCQIPNTGCRFRHLQFRVREISRTQQAANGKKVAWGTFDSLDRDIKEPRCRCLGLPRECKDARLFSSAVQLRTKVETASSCSSEYCSTVADCLNWHNGKQRGRKKSPREVMNNHRHSRRLMLGEIMPSPCILNCKSSLRPAALLAAHRRLLSSLTDPHPSIHPQLCQSRVNDSHVQAPHRVGQINHPGSMALVLAFTSPGSPRRFPPIAREHICHVGAIRPQESDSVL